MNLLLDTGNYVDGIDGICAHHASGEKDVRLKVNQVAEEGHDTAYDLPMILDVLTQSGYDGTLSIEYEGEQDEKIYIKEATDFVRACLQE